MIKKIAFLILLLLVPFFIAALDVNSIPEPKVTSLTVPGFINKIFNFLWPIAVAVIIIMFVIAGLKFLTAQGNPQQIAEARSAVLWGVVGIIVVILAFTIISLVTNAFGLT